MRALIVEDDLILANLWQAALAAEGHESHAVNDAEPARKLLLTQSFDAVVLDLCLGDNSGLSVAALATYTNPHCRVVVVTGSTLFARGELFSMAPNIAAVLRKPVTLQELVAVLEYDIRHPYAMAAYA